MRTSGRNIGGRLGLALVVVAALAGVAAAEAAVTDVPAGEVFVVTAALVPGPGGGEVASGIKGQEHVNFRVRFGADGSLTVNGVAAGPCDPCATYHVSVLCQRVDGQWIATTDIMNQNTGAIVFHQHNYVMAGAVEEFQATADHVIQLSAQ